MCERELETEQNCNILTPTLLAITAFLSRSPGLLNRRPGGSAFLWHVPQSSIFYPTRLIPNWSDLQNCNCSIGGLRAHSAGCWLSLPHLYSNWSGLQTNWLPIFTELYNSSTLTFSLWASQIALIQPIHGQGYNSDIPRPDAPVIYIGALPILTARPGRRSIYNNSEKLRIVTS